MSDAREGKGIDRHLLGLWCAAFENNYEAPAIFEDPLFKKR
jgi:carnitine O-octanoyltransferase